MRRLRRQQLNLQAGLRSLQTQFVQDRLPQNSGDPRGSHQDQRDRDDEEQKLPRWVGKVNAVNMWERFLEDWGKLFMILSLFLLYLTGFMLHIINWS